MPIIGLECECYAPIRVGRGCMACMRRVGRRYMETVIATNLAQGMEREPPPPMPMRRNRKQRRK